MSKPTEGDQTILNSVGELEALLYGLNQKIDSLVKKDTILASAGTVSLPTANNVFDEIIQSLTICEGLVRGILDKVILEIIHKVQ